MQRWVNLGYHHSTGKGFWWPFNATLLSWASRWYREMGNTSWMLR